MTNVPKLILEVMRWGSPAMKAELEARKSHRAGGRANGDPRTQMSVLKSKAQETQREGKYVRHKDK